MFGKMEQLFDFVASFSCMDRQMDIVVVQCLLSLFWPNATVEALPAIFPVIGSPNRVGRQGALLLISIGIKIFHFHLSIKAH